MFSKKEFAFTLSLILHLSFFFAAGSLLPHSSGDRKIVRVFLAADFFSSAEGPATSQTKAGPESLPAIVNSETLFSTSSASTSPISSGGKLESDCIQPSRPAPTIVKRRPAPVSEPGTEAVSHASPVKLSVVDKSSVAKKASVLQSISMSDKADRDKGPQGVIEEHAGPASKTTSKDSNPAAGASELSFGKEYFASVFAKIEAAKRYPRVAIRRRMEGNVEVVFRLGRDGSLLAVDLADSSGYPSLDEAAIAAVNRAAPFPRLPGNVKNIPESLKITIAFILSVKD